MFASESVKRIVACTAAIVFMAGAADVAAREAPRARNGAIDLRDWDFAHDGIVELVGEWTLQRGQFRDPALPYSAGQGVPSTVPAPWGAGSINGEPAGADGYGTYFLTVACGRAEDLALALPVESSALRLYVNGRSIANQGSPGPNRELSRPAATQQIVSLQGLSCPLRIVVQLSNFDYSRGGLIRSIGLGTQRELLERRERGLMRDLIVLGGLGVMGLLPLLFFVWRRNDPMPLYFGFFSLFLALLTGLSGERALLPYVAPLGWDVYVKLVFLSLCACLVLFPMFVRALFPQRLRLGALRLIVACGIAASLCIVATPAGVFTYGIPALELAAAMLTAYLLVVLGRAALAGRTSAAFLFTGLALFAAAVAHDVAYADDPDTSELAPFGTIALVLVPAVLLARRFARALAGEEMRSIEQRQRVDLLVRATKAGLLDWNATTGTVVYSERYKEIRGYSPDADTSTWPDFFATVHPEERKIVHEAFLAQLRERGTRDGVHRHAPWDHRLLRADGEYVWVHTEAISLTDGDGHTLRYICSFIDISEQKRHEQEMADRIRFVGDVFESVPTMLAMRDLEGRFVHVNRMWEIISGKTREEVIGKTPYAFRSAADADILIEMDKAAIAQYGRFGAASTYEPQERTIRGRRFLQSRCVVPDAQGRPTAVIIASIETTERYAMEQALASQAAQLERQNDALKESVRLREEVDRMGRHDLKTPLTSIIAVPRLLREGRTLSREEDDLLGLVERAGYRLLNMVNLSLDLFKMEEGRYRFAPQAVDLVGLLAKLVTDVASQAASRGVRLQLPIEPCPYVWGEELLCYSMLGNLVKNAIEASPEGGAVTMSIDADAAEEIALAIHNTGAVPESVRETFFEKYATAGKSEGTGLGTYSARLMARTQGGDIIMQTGQDDGTTITVRLRKAPAGAVPADTRAAPSEDAPSARTAALPALRVLVVDDDEYNRLIVRRYLPSPPLSVAVAVNGRSAVDTVRADPVDVILMDLDMPVMGGDQAAALIRDLEKKAGRARCTIVALSSHEDDETKQRCLASGFDRYLVKPVAREVLHRTLRDVAATNTTTGRELGPERPAANAPVVVDGDIEDTLPQFLESRREALDQFDEAFRAGDAEQLRRIAHRLAGSFALYGFRWAAEVCSAMAQQAARGETQGLAQSAAALRDHLATVEIRVRRGAGAQESLLRERGQDFDLTKLIGI